MATYIGLLRAVNVGGTGTLAMRDLVALCGQSGFTGVRTYIQSGNVVLSSRLSAEKVRTTLERSLSAHMDGRQVDVLVRAASDVARVLAGNPFPGAPPAKVVVHFSSDAVPAASFRGLTGPDDEQVVVGPREIYVYYVNGQGRSRLKLPKVPGILTARNLNTVAKLVELAGGR